MGPLRACTLTANQYSEPRNGRSFYGGTNSSNMASRMTIGLIAPSWLTVIPSLLVALIVGKTLPPGLDRARARDLDSNKPINSQYG